MLAATAGGVAATVAALTVVAAPSAARIVLRGANATTGSMVSGFGTGFSPGGSRVQLTLNSPSGPPLWSGGPEDNGNIEFAFTVPNVTPGSYSVVASQTAEDGAPVSGTPATAALQINAAQDGPWQSEPAGSPTTNVPTTGVPSAPARSAAPLPSVAPIVFTLPAHSAVRLANPPPQVATMWRLAGAVPNFAPALAAAGEPATSLAAPATPTGSREAPSVLTLAALGVLIASAMIVIATTLHLRSTEAPAPVPAPPPASPHRTGRSRSATKRSMDNWSGSPARYR